MIRLTQRLLEKGYAYEKFRSVYFDISRFRGYGRLSRVDLEKIHVGKTVDLEQYEKENPRDFTLLKRSTLSELKKGIFHETRWGKIRPSWHLECPAMAMKYLGDTYDIHTSGIDLLFPHHENAIAISQGVTGKPPANYWLHNERVTVNGKKPGRDDDSAVYTVKNLLEQGYTGREIRYWLISHHYRKPLTFSPERLDMAKRTLSHLDQFTRKLQLCRTAGSNPELDQLLYDLRQGFAESMNDDLNVAQALSALFDFTRRMNRWMETRGLSRPDRDRVERLLKDIDSVLGIMDLTPPPKDDAAEDLIRRREEARKSRDWAEADQIREQLKGMGVEVIDTAEGPLWKKT
jgi:cysteinyl-tRNA synthetase